jgi:hypothetical protein
VITGKPMASLATFNTLSGPMTAKVHHAKRLIATE